MTRARVQRMTAAIAIVAAIIVVMADAHPQGEPTRFGVIERLDPRIDEVIARDAVLERVAEGIEWGEGPLWDPASNSLLFSDIPRNGIFRWTPGGGVTLAIDRSGYTGSAPFTGREPGSNGLTFDSSGRLVIAQHGDRRIVRREHDGSFTVLADRFEGRRFNSPNDLVYRSNGDLFFTDPPYGLPATFKDPARELPFQGVYRLTPRGELNMVVSDLSAPNGVAFSPDNRILYVSNSDRQRPVWMAYSVRDDGTLSEGWQFAEASQWVRDGDGLPDGLKVNARGHVFATGPGGIHIFAPDGARLGRIQTGVPSGNLNWGEDGTVLYITANHWICRLRTKGRS